MSEHRLFVFFSNMLELYVHKVFVTLNISRTVSHLMLNLLVGKAYWGVCDVYAEDFPD